jgi:hypothetical protein
MRSRANEPGTLDRSLAPATRDAQASVILFLGRVVGPERSAPRRDDLLAPADQPPPRCHDNHDYDHGDERDVGWHTEDDE